MGYLNLYWVHVSLALQGSKVIKKDWESRDAGNSSKEKHLEAGVRGLYLIQSVDGSH